MALSKVCAAIVAAALLGVWGCSNTASDCDALGECFDPQGSGGGGGGGASGCPPLAIESCYEGPSGTEGVGICRAGTHSCLADGTAWGPCEGQRLPEQEDCVGLQDEDCDGAVIADACVCKVATSEACYTGPDGTEGVGVCHAGTHTCQGDGEAWSMCTGEVAPLVESCENDLDDDCDGGACATVAWAKLAGDSLDDSASAVAMTSSGEAIVGGTFTGMIDWGGGANVGSSGAPSLFVTKLDRAGGSLWTKVFSGATTGFSEASLTAAAADSSGRVAAAGSFAGSVTFGGTTFTGTPSVFVAVLDPEGAHVWSTAYGTDAAAWGVAFDAAGDLFVGGDFEGTLFAGGVTLTSNPGRDMFLIKHGPTGAVLWAKRFGQTMVDDVISAVAVDALGNPVVAGSYKATTSIGTTTLQGMGADDAFVAKLNADGDTLWAATFGDSMNQNARGVAIDSAGDVFVTGGFEGAIGSGAQVATSAGLFDIFAAKLDAFSGTPTWIRRFGDAGTQIGAAAASWGDRMLLTGIMTGTVDAGTGLLTSNGLYDAFVIELEADGTPRWGRSYGGSGYDIAYALAATPTGTRAFLAGASAGGIDLGNGVLTGHGGFDAFLASIDP